MPRIRSIKPETWKSESVASRLPGPDGRQARLLWIAMWNFAEDHGLVRGNPRYLLSEIFPYEEDLTPADVERWLVLLERAGRIVRFDRDGSPFVFIRGFTENQRIDKPNKSPTIAPPTDVELKAFDERSRNVRGTFLDRSSNVLGGSGVDGSGVEGSRWEAKKNDIGDNVAHTLATQIRPEPPRPATERPSERLEGHRSPFADEAREFFAWVWETRSSELGALPEGVPADAEAWYAAARARLAKHGRGGDAELRATYRSYLASDWARAPERKPRAPWDGFRRNWEKHVPAGPAKGVPAPGASPLKIIRPAGGAT